MILKDSDGNEFVEMIYVDETTAMEKFHPITHCLVVVMVGDDYLLGWNQWRNDWEIFGGCMEDGESMRQCIVRECLEEIGISNEEMEYIGLMHLHLAPDYFSSEYRKEYGGLYGMRLQPADLEKIEACRLDKEEIGKIACLKQIAEEEKIAEIDRELLKYYGGSVKAENTVAT